MPCGWEGNRRSGVTLAMRHRLQWFIQLWAHGLRKGDEHPAYTPHGVRHTLPVLCMQNVNSTQPSVHVGSHGCAAVRSAAGRGHHHQQQQHRDQLASIGSSMLQAFQPPSAASATGIHSACTLTYTGVARLPSG